MDSALRPWGSPGKDAGWVAMPASRRLPVGTTRCSWTAGTSLALCVTCPEDRNCGPTSTSPRNFFKLIWDTEARAPPQRIYRDTHGRGSRLFPTGPPALPALLRTTPSAGHTQTSWGLRGAKDNSASQDGKQSHRRDGKLAPWRAGPAVVRVSLPPHPPREKWMRS